MKSKVISFILCIAVLAATVSMVRYNPSDAPITNEETKETEEIISTYEDTTTVARAFVTKTAREAEDFILRLAYGDNKEFETSSLELIEHLNRAGEYLRTTLSDHYGAGYFSCISDLIQNVVTTPFSDSANFSTRVSSLLTQLELSYPTQSSTGSSNDSSYYPKFDTEVNGATTLAMLAIYRQQYQKSTNSILLTVGGNLSLGDSLGNSGTANNFDQTQANSPYAYPLYKVSSIFNTDSVSYANLQSPFTNSYTTNVLDAVKGLPAYANLLLKGGIDVVSLTDPNVLTFGDTGKQDTILALNQAGVKYSDFGTVAYYQTTLGTVAYLSYDIIDEISTNVNLTYTAPKQDIAAARANGAKFVVVHFNWVNTFRSKVEPSSSQVYTTRAAVDNGADLVFGSHPDHVEGIENYKGVSIIYSCGNLSKKGSEENYSYLYQQAFSLDENGKVVRGDILAIPVANHNTSDGVPSLLLDTDSAEEFEKNVMAWSISIRYGIGKAASIPVMRLNVISIAK